LLTLKRKLETSCAVCVCVLVAQLCPTLCYPMDCSPPDSSVHGILQARIVEWVVISFSNCAIHFLSKSRCSSSFVVFHSLSCSHCNPMDGSMPGFSVLQHLPIFAKPMFIESVMSSNHLILCHLLAIQGTLKSLFQYHGWPLDGKSRLTGKDLMLGKVEGRKRRR